MDEGRVPGLWAPQRRALTLGLVLTITFVASEALAVVTVGEKTGGAEDVVPEVHAETAMGTRRVRAPQQRTVSLALSGVPAIVPRTFMDPPHAPGR